MCKGSWHVKYQSYKNIEENQERTNGQNELLNDSK